MSAPALIQRLKTLKINIQLVDNQLNINAPKGILTPELISQIRAQREEIINFLKRLKKISPFKTIKPVEKKQYYQLSSVQKRLYFLQQLHPESTAYNMPIDLYLRSNVDTVDIESVFKKLIHRHKSLRTSFDMVNEEPMQRIHDPDEIEFAIEYCDASICDCRTEVCSPKGIRRIIGDFIRPFDLSQLPLLRVKLVKGGTNGFIFLFDMHHIILDGSSRDILRKEFMMLHKKESLSPLRIQYEDYSQWQNSPEQKGELIKQEAYWLQVFSNNWSALILPTDYPRPQDWSAVGRTVDFVINKTETVALKKICKRSNTTLYMVLLAGFYILLAKLSGQEDIVVGNPIQGRLHPDLGQIVGMLANTLAMRNYPAGYKTFNEFLKEVKEQTIAAFENQEYPFGDLVEKVAVERDTSRNPLFDVMFNLLNMGEYRSVTSDSREDEIQMTWEETSKFDLNLTAIDRGEGIFFKLEYCSLLFKSTTIDRIIDYFKKILFELSKIGSGERKLCEIEIINEEEKHMLLYEFNNTKTDFILEQTLHQLFQERLPKSYSKVALVFRDMQITYEELNRKINRFARVLRARGVAPGEIIGLLVDRSIEMVIGILAILKAGGAYLPIDSEYPKERKRKMLGDSKVRMLLAGWDNSYEKPGIPGKFEMINVWDECLFSGDTANLSQVNQGADLAYVIYTSGSTGSPKGIMLEHRNLVNLLYHGYLYTNLDFSTVLQFSTISFDASFHEIFSVLLFGERLCLIDSDVRADIMELFKIIEKMDIKTLFLPISFLKMIFNEAFYREMFPSCVTHIQSAGEQVVVSDSFKNYLNENNIYLHNHYGPAETHVVTIYSRGPAEEIPEFPPIGRPISNTQIYILDKHGQLQPLWIPGELFIGGIQVGRGYLDKVDMTAERFVPDPFNKGGRLYRSGDLGRWVPDGIIEFLGRIDNQVKIRGFRIEPGEIESQLMKIDYIKEALVIDGEDDRGDKYLCAYIVTEKEPDNVVLRRRLSTVLPDYMIPSHFVVLDKFPLTGSGKIARKELPIPEVGMAEGGNATPRNRLEEKLAVIWSEVLEVNEDRIGIDTNFFYMGGHSLKATQLISKIHRVFDVSVPLAQIFKTPTIRGLWEYIKNAGRGKFYFIAAAEEKEYYPLSSSQLRLYVLHRMAPESTVYNMPQIEFLEGDTDFQKIERTLRKLIERHESFRTSFTLVDNKPFQKISKEVEFTLDYSRIKEGNGHAYIYSPKEIKKLLNHFVKPFDLGNAPLLRVGVIKAGKRQCILLFDIHHIIFDGISHDILIEEFRDLYEEQELLHLSIQYKDFSQWQNSEMYKKSIEKMEEYWVKQFAGGVPKSNLRVDYKRPEIPGFEGNTINFKIDKEKTRQLLRIGKLNKTTMFMVLLTIYYILLAKLSGQEDIVIGVPVAGRRHDGLDRIIGLFVNTLALRNKPGREKKFSDFLNEIKNNTLAAFENQDYQFENLLQKVVKKIDMKENPLFDVMFSFHNYMKSKTMKTSKNIDNSNDYVLKNATTKFDLILHAFYNDIELFCSFEYSTKLYKEETIKRFIVYFNAIIESIVNNHDIILREIKISSEFLISKSVLSEVEFKFS